MQQKQRQPTAKWQLNISWAASSLSPGDRN
jgi:hypothetical protein